MSNVHSKKKKRKINLKKAGIAVLSASVVTAGTVGLVSAYQNGIDYTPSENTRELNDNQVVFSDYENSVAQKDEKKKQESELLKKEKEGQDISKQRENSNYLFEDSNITVPGSTTTTIAEEDGAVEPSSAQADHDSGTKDSVDASYSVSRDGDTDNADIVIDLGNADRNTGDTIAANGTGLGNLAGGDGSSQGGSTAENPKGDNQGGGSKGDSDKDHTGGTEDSGGSGGKKDPSADDITTTRPSNTVKDPESEKSNPTGGNLFVYKPYVEGVAPKKDADESGDSGSVVISALDDNNSYKLYKGQSVSKRDMFNSLTTYVVGKDGTFYMWGANDYGTYIRVDEVSFDGGVTWEKDFPVQIPEQIEEGQMVMKVSYRISVNDTKWVERTVGYNPSDGRIFVLSRKVKDKESAIDVTTILNSAEQYPSIGTNLNLYYMQMKYFGEQGNLTALFPGWTEDGEDVSWFYPVTGGRHILEPKNMVELPSCYTVQLKHIWMTEDYQMDGSAREKLCYLQTLTDVDGLPRLGWSDSTWEILWNMQTIKVPEYIQAIMIDADAGLSVDYLEVPDTVLYIEVAQSGMRVNSGYKVAEGNLRYSSTADGLLMNKAQTEILSIPYNRTEISISDSVQRVYIEKKNCLQKLTIKEAKDGTLPEIDYRNLKNCQVTVPDAVLESFIAQNQESFASDTGNTVNGYYVQDGMILDQADGLWKVISAGQKRLKIPEKITYVRSGALNEADTVTSLVLPQSGKKIVFETGSLAGSQVNTILCYGKEQYDSVLEQLEEAGIDDISVEMLLKSKEGYGYSTEYKDGAETVTLIDIPEDVETFDGTVTAEDGTAVVINEIGDRAFLGCGTLKWVMLPQSVEMIGSQAFADCVNLQGVLIRNEEDITIGNGAFDGCTSMRFAASNAKNGTFLDGYDLAVTDKRGNNFFYIPTEPAGYGTHGVWFNAESGVSGYDLVSDGGDGWILYGLNADGEPWLVLRSGETVGNQVSLPESTIEIFSYAFADTKAENGGSYHVNFTDTPVWAFDDGAFENSAIGTDVVLNANSWLFDSAFAGCENLISIDIPGYYGIQLDWNLFTDCTNLKTVRIGSVNANSSGLYAGMFNGCNRLEELYLEDWNPVKLIRWGTSGFRFNYLWTDEEQENLKIHVPEGAEGDYIREWRYTFAGYTDEPEKTCYLQMWDDVYFENVNWDTWEVPTNEEVDALVKERVLEYDNMLRAMLGMEKATEPMDFYPYRKDPQSGKITLIGAPSDIQWLNLYDADRLGIPYEWYVGRINKNTFADTKGLEELFLPDTLTEIESGAFHGIESEKLILYCMEADPINLILEDGQPFSFGVEDDSLCIKVWGGDPEEYIRAWSYKLAGFDDLDAMRAAVREELTTDSYEPTDAEVDSEIADRLLPQVNRLRRMMEMEETEEIDREAFGLVTDASAEEQDATEQAVDVKQEEVTESTEESETDSEEADEAKTEHETKAEERENTSGTEESGSGEETKE